MPGNKYRMKPSLNREFYIRFAAEFGYEIDIPAITGFTVGQYCHD